MLLNEITEKNNNNVITRFISFVCVCVFRFGMDLGMQKVPDKVPNFDYEKCANGQATHTHTHINTRIDGLFLFFSNSQIGPWTRTIRANKEAGWFR